MNKSFWILTNKSSSNLSVLGKNVDISRQMNNPYIPNYMNPTYTKQMAFAFMQKNKAVDFMGVDIHKKKILSASASELVFENENSYDLPDHLCIPLNLFQENDDTITDRFLTKLVLSSMVHFFVIENVFQTDSRLTLDGFVVNPTPQIEEEHVELFLHILEENYTNS